MSSTIHMMNKKEKLLLELINKLDLQYYKE